MTNDLSLLLDLSYKGFMLDVPILAKSQNQTTEEFIRSVRSCFNPKSKSFKILNNFEDKTGLLFTYANKYIFYLLEKFVNEEYVYQIDYTDSYYHIAEFEHKINGKYFAIVILIQDGIIISHRVRDSISSIINLKTEYYTLEQINNDAYKESEILAYLKMSVKEYRTMCKSIIERSDNANPNN